MRRTAGNIPPDRRDACPTTRSASSQRGIALVVTLILLAVVTFLAVAFLFLTTRERGAVGTHLDMTAARLTTEGATERAKIEVIASIISSNSAFNYGLLVSTTYVNSIGFKSQPLNSPSQTTNVNYDYKADGSAFSVDDRNQNIQNLFYNARPPVFPRTNRTEMFYLDLNRNGRFDTNGSIPVLDDNGLTIIIATTNGPMILSNYFTGDPEWIGQLYRPDRPHSASNWFTGRYAYIVVPEGSALDANKLHNQSKLNPPTQDGFSRNMGFGTWEMNFASFLVDLNTNVWQAPGPISVFSGGLITPAPYLYNANPAPATSQGTAFEDALGLTRYRYDGDWNNLRTVTGSFGVPGADAFRTDMADGYGSGPLNVANTPPPVDGDAPARVNFGWPGADNPNHFFTTQDFFDRNKTIAPGQVPPNTFSDRLRNVGIYARGSYDRYTYYRMLSQLGTDNGPEPAGKLHLTYVNVNATGQVIPDLQTNFVAWQPLQFFTNAADRMLRATFADTNFNRLNFGLQEVISMTNIPVLVNTQLVYSAGLHRIFQLAANLYDSSTNRGDTTFSGYPSVFRPVFNRRPNGDVFVNGFTEVNTVTGPADPLFVTPLDMSEPADQALAGTVPGQNIYGVPWVIGAKKGFPNFNEFAMQSVAQITRRLQFRQRALTTVPYTTNQLFSLGVSNTFAFEAWNSYRGTYQRAIDIQVVNDMSVGFTYTNDPVHEMRGGVTGTRITLSGAMSLPANAWSGYGTRISDPSKTSFIIPLERTITFMADSYFRTRSGAIVFPTNTAAGVNLFRGFEQTGLFHQPEFGLSITNRIRFIMIDTATKRVIDYVQIGNLNGVRNLTSELQASPASFTDAASGANRSETIFWQTNRPFGPALASPPNGVINQIQASLGEVDVPNWNDFGVGQAAGRIKEKEIDAFRHFMGLPSKYNTGAVSTNTDIQAPFTPTRKTSQYISWQANDPLVHYVAGDLGTATASGTPRREQPGGPILPIPNIRELNERFEPWGGSPDSSAAASSTVPPFSLETKDPGVRVSDDWDFPTNKYAALGMIGRVHRGTPWQTVYLKANGVDNGQWRKWSGNSNTLDSLITRPVMDRLLFDVFTTAVDANSTRGQFNVNQAGLAALSATLGGVIGLTNSSSDAELRVTSPVARVDPLIIEPAGVDLNNSSLGKIHDGINRTRAARQGGVFRRAADILATPELTVASPLLNTNSTAQLQFGINDATYERLPQMLMGLLRGNDQPRFAIYAYGQSLQRGRRVTSAGPYSGLCTNYTVTAEFATRTVVRIEGAPGAPRAVVESFNILPPD